MSDRSLELLMPTVRKAGSEIWMSWNPRHPSDPVDRFFRCQQPPDKMLLVKANFADNPYFSEELRSHADTTWAPSSTATRIFGWASMNANGGCDLVTAGVVRAARG